MDIPETIMKQAFEKLRETKKLFKEAEKAYKKRNSNKRADKQNAFNVALAISHLSEAYAEVSAIYENDLEE